ncbi:DUF2911 domain-containing protein [Roseivirga sp.]|uniref:DUF2911 domain-containing protein n=1 Tax=Roseivirga sp. TaxID=1964215 RepID=UPI003B8C8691
MKRSFFLVALTLAFVAVNAQAQKFPGLDPSPMDKVFYPGNVPLSDLRGGDYVAAKVKLVYSRPQLKGRDMMGKIVNGKMWRMGANEANEITFYQDVTIGDTKVSAGTYSLFAMPSADKWTFVLHSKLNTWGNFALKNSKEVARVDGPVSKSDDSIEALSMMFKEVEGGLHLMIGWQNTIAEMPIKM